MIGSSKGEDFGGYSQALKKKGVLNQESVKSGRYVPRPKPPIGPGVFPNSGLDIYEVPGRDDVFNYIFHRIYGARAPSFFILAENEIQIPDQYDITLQINSFFTEKIPAVYFFAIRIRSV